MVLNLTEEKRVAWKIQGVGPDPAHSLVVFKKVGTGKTLYKVLQPGEALKLGLFKSSEDYVAYAISRDANLRHSFSRKYQAASQLWSFTLHFELDFQVSEVETLGLKLEGGDPLLLLVEEVAKVLGANARQLSWEALKQEGSGFGISLLDSESTGGSGAQVRNFDHLRNFAAQLGLGLRNVDITRSLMEEDVSDDLTDRTVGFKYRVNESAQRLEIQERVHRQEIELIDARGKQVMQGMERLRTILDGVAKESVRGISQAVDEVRSFAAINDALQLIPAIQASLMGLSAGASSAPSLQSIDRPLMQGASVIKVQLAGMKGTTDPLESLVMEAFQHLHALDRNSSDKRRIIATTLHVLAEASLGDEGDGDYLTACSENLERSLYFLKGSLDTETLSFFRRISDAQQLKQALGGDDD